MEQISASAPGKLMLFGEHSVVYGHPSIVTAVDQRLKVIIKKNGVNLFKLDAPDLGLKAYSKTMDDLGKQPLPKAVRFVETFYKNFLKKYPQTRGIDVVTRSDFAHTFGFGSSSAVTVAFAKALTTLYGFKFSKKELFDLCYEAVIEVQGVGSGFDLAAAIWGGTIYYIPPAETVEALKVDLLPMVVGYTGVKADTPTIVRLVQSMRSNNREKIDGIFTVITEIVEKGRKAIENKDWKKVGELMNQNQELLCKLQVSSIELEKLIKGANRGGAIGAKLSGAGGGDCMIALVKKDKVNREAREGALGYKKKVEQAIEEAGGQVIEVKLNAEGVRLEE